MFLSTFGAQGQKFSTEIERITHKAVQSIEAKGVTFSKASLQNSEEIAKVINDASAHATSAINRTVTDLDTTARGAIERSQKAASAAVTEMMETHGMLRNDTSALFERLREANVLLQEVLGGATQNLSTIETTLSGRVSEFVTTMNDIGERSGAVSGRFEEQMKAFLSGTGTMLRDITSTAEKFEEQGRALASAADADRRQQQAHRRDDGRPPRGARLRRQPDRQQGRRPRSAAQALLGAAAGDLRGSPKARARDIARIVAGILDRRHQVDLQPVRTGARDHRRRAQAHQRSAALDLRAGDGRDLRAVPPDQRALRRDRAPDEAK